MSESSQTKCELMYLTPADLSERWNGRIAVRTLANWRSSGCGPEFIRMGGKILYPVKKIEDWEKRNTFSSTHEYCADDGGADVDETD
jgi:hypothetical protein